MKKIGIYFGTFAPMHIGHLQQVYKAAFENDQVLLVASGYDTDRGAQIGLTLDKRLSALTEFFADEKQIHVRKLDENDLPPMPTGWDEWTARLLSLIDEIADNQPYQATFYVGEPEYLTELTKRFPQNANIYRSEIASRLDVPISATEIRKSPQKNWAKIIPTYHQFFEKTVQIQGQNAPQIAARLNKLFSAYGINSVSADRNNFDLIIKISKENPLTEFYQAIDKLNDTFGLEVLHFQNKKQKN